MVDQIRMHPGARPMRPEAQGGIARRSNRDGGIPSLVVHELRTPLTAIHGYTQLIERNPANQAAVMRASGVILQETRRLAELLNHLSEVAELDADLVTHQPVVTDVVGVVRDVVDRARRRSGLHALAVLNDGPVVGRCDPRRLGQLLSHLVANAICYAPDGGRVPISVGRCHNEVHITVFDPGLGIAPEEHERVYERYFRGQSATRTGVRGLGLGLYLAREVAARCGGRVWHEPGDNGGTVFHLVLPDA